MGSDVFGYAAAAPAPISCPCRLISDWARQSMLNKLAGTLLFNLIESPQTYDVATKLEIFSHYHQNMLQMELINNEIKDILLINITFSFTTRFCFW